MSTALPSYVLLSSALLFGLLGVGCAAESAAASSPAPRAKELAALPIAQPRPARLRIAVVSDMNGRYGSARYDEAVHSAVDRLLEMQPDLVLSTGDMVAGQRRGLDYPRMWQGFHSVVSDRLADAGVPFAVTPGNHDGSGYDAFAPERAQFVEEWQARRPDVEMVDDTNYPLRYSFRRGPAFFVSLDATAVGPLGDEQMRWLDQQLAASEDAVKVVFGHVPLYPFAHGRERETIGDPHLESLLRRRGVDLFLSGHHHAFYPGRRGPLRLVSLACLGGGPRPLIGTDAPSPKSMVVFDVTPQGIERLDGWSGPGFDQLVRRGDLPLSVGDGETRIDRDDIGLPSRPIRVSLR